MPEGIARCTTCGEPLTPEQVKQPELHTRRCTGRPFRETVRMTTNEGVAAVEQIVRETELRD